ncbi:hypothetical protein VKA11_20790 [Bacillus paranthracis]|uniref:hypothetical protein n=1 Tax=Bacillus paranthracis TaxID=2026186 RepID=UPI000A39C9C0|nr:hypothetical protein BK786_28900 [Bacillus thuringiensis serovar thailandensis]
MNTTMVINRMDNWFVFNDVYNDPFYVAITLLERLFSRPKMGLEYNRLDIIGKLKHEKSQKSLESIDKAIILLSSKSLIRIQDNAKKMCTSTLYITPKGVLALEEFRKEMENVHKKN